MTTRTIAVVAAGLSQPSSTRLLADRLSASVAASLQEQGITPQVEVIEVRDHGHELVDNMVTGFPAPALAAALDAVARADGLIVVTPVFQASYTGLFKMFFDVLDSDALAGKPVLMAATGGTARHSLALEHALRPLFAHLRAITVPTAVYAAAEDWGSSGDGTGLAERVARAAGELTDLVAARPAFVPADPFELPATFEQMLAGS
jgi:FMN reductase